MIDDAGWSTTSGVSVVAGTFVAFGAVALIAAAAGALGSTLGIDTDGISTDEWRQAGIAGAAVAALVLFASFFFGGYTAGRMSRRAGARHGVLVFLLSVVLMAGIGVAAWGASDTPTTDDVTESIDDTGVPTDSDTWSDIGIGAGIAAIAAMLIGSIAGGIRGDRWHGRLAEAVATGRTPHVDEHEVRESDDRVDTDVFDRTRTIDIRDDDRDGQLSVEEERERTGRSF
jgi:hypothetical protein